ncbi:hypothetical protein [Pedococcus sp. 5OH_020]|uniref:hypothetical protein n=1 Tax=Pedococcus sp. 5OH_020 TaxID=2989814 RepID=UPI0022EA0C91|nr:hypothetical protein [Pedococcus sp. 5OH_020]
MKHQHRLGPLVAQGHLPVAGRLCRPMAAAALTAVVVTACGGAPPRGGDVTVTVTPTVTASGTGAVGSNGSADGAAPPTSDDKGRAYDFGVVRKVSDVAGTSVLELDRWTWKGLADTKLAAQGVPLGPFKGAEPYENQNARLTYTLPVADGARVLYHHCVAADEPLQTKSVDPGQLTGLADGENTVLVKLDDQGRVVAADNIPGCPS